MTFLRGIYRFLYDFIIGDDWKIAAASVTALAVGLIALILGVPVPMVAPTTAVLVAAAFTLALIVDVRVQRRSGAAGGDDGVGKKP